MRRDLDPFDALNPLNLEDLPKPNRDCRSCGATRPHKIMVGWSVNQNTRRWLCPQCTDAERPA